MATFELWQQADDEEEKQGGRRREGVDRERGNRTRERVTKNLLSHVCLCGNR